ncbi:hypothetical protein [Caballeronia sp. LZ016]|jgi:hypothetical protein|uniref:hypothetical protein n=1 Tax=Caballeronia sp. LZ016 TaxID=3038554 RepID=UPI0028547DBB|nr:hypothetical protein [Caballeronia sp. LZ016]MDR5740075.1 hypothetical protein [Caballeronia sp. LZ016]
MDESDVRNLVGEIFELTGQKVEVSDPIVSAALIQSEMLRKAGAEAAASITAASVAAATRARRPSSVAAVDLTDLNIVTAKLLAAHTPKRLWITSLTSAFVASVICLTTVAITGRQGDDDARIGRAVSAAFPLLDRATREKIQTAINKAASTNGR